MSGPTQQALEFMRQDGGPLSNGERILLLAAFALWNGDGGLTFADVLGLDFAPSERLLSLVSAMKQGAAAVDAWIAS